MSNYIFRFPAGCPLMTYDALTQLISARWYPMPDGTRYAKIGTTVTVRPRNTGGNAPVIDICLYGTRIARLTQGFVCFGRIDDPHAATTEWLGKIIRDNGLGSAAFRIRRRTADGPGPRVARGQAGVLVIDGDRTRPVTGQLYKTSQVLAAAF